MLFICFAVARFSEHLRALGYVDVASMHKDVSQQRVQLVHLQVEEAIFFGVFLPFLTRARRNGSQHKRLGNKVK